MNLLKIPTRKTWLAVIVVVVAVVLGWHFTHNTPANKKIVTAGTPVASPDQSRPANNSLPAKKPVAGSDASPNSGGATDTKGTAKASTDSSQWTTSASGDITVKSPTANSKFRSGNVIAGSAKVSQVHYRLSDNEIGVIAQGTLDVVKGNFSGTLHFNSHGTGGRLDVFSTDSRGVEYNEVQINVRF